MAILPGKSDRSPEIYRHFLLGLMALFAPLQPQFEPDSGHPVTAWRMVSFRGDPGEAVAADRSLAG